MAKNKNNSENKENLSENVNTENEETVKEENEISEKQQAENEALKKELDETKDKLLRTVAEYDNFRKRTQKEKEAIYAEAKTDAISKLLPVLDNFERASESDSDFESYKKGIDMTVTGLLNAFASMGAEAFGKVGDDFDPNIHNAVMHVEDENFGENKICEIFLKGYKIGDRIIRHATVKVAN